MMNDWGYDNGYCMKERQFILKKYKPLHISNDHDHCKFCWEKFSISLKDCLKEGWQTKYTITYKGETRISDSWVCMKCFEDFKVILKLKEK